RERAHGVWRENGVGVERDDQFTARVSQTGIERRRLPAVWNGKQPDALVRAKLLADDFARIVLRTIVDDDDFVFRVVRRKQTANCVSDYQLFVVRRNDDRDER